MPFGVRWPDSALLFALLISIELPRLPEESAPFALRLLKGVDLDGSRRAWPFDNLSANGAGSDQSRYDANQLVFFSHALKIKAAPGRRTPKVRAIWSALA